MTIEEIVISYLADENIEGIGDHVYAEDPWPISSENTGSIRRSVFPGTK